MINFNFSINVPWLKYYALKCWHGSITDYKKWEVELQRSSCLIMVSFNYNRKTDHAGVNVTLGILGIELMATIYDKRHWDYNTDNWAS